MNVLWNLRQAHNINVLSQRTPNTNFFEVPTIPVVNTLIGDITKKSITIFVITNLIDLRELERIPQIHYAQ